MSDSAIVLGGAGLYLVVVLAIGLLASRKVHDSADFIVAGRRLPMWLCTFTLFATWFGAGTCMGAAGVAYSEGFLGVIADPFGAGLCLLLAGLFYVRILRRMRLLTIPDFFRLRFGRGAELLSSVCIFPAYIGWSGSQFVAFGYILHSLTGIDTTWAMILGAICVLLYTIAGGMWAVSITDFVQAIILIAGLILLSFLVLPEVGGWEGLREKVPEAKFALTPQDGGLKEWIWYLQAWLVIGIGSIPGQDLMQRSMGARTENAAQWSCYFSALMYFTIGVIPVFLGIAGALLIPDIGDPELILPELGMKYLHPVGMALFVGALLSALMSSADSALLAPASICAENLLNFLVKNPSQRLMLMVARVAVLVNGLAALVAALYFKAIYTLMVNSWSVLMVSLFVPFTAGLYWKKTNGLAAVTSILLGTGSWIGMLAYQSEYPDSSLADYPADLLATGIAVVTLVVVTLATSNRNPSLPLTDFDGKAVAYQDRLGVLGLFSKNASQTEEVQ